MQDMGEKLTKLGTFAKNNKHAIMGPIATGSIGLGLFYWLLLPNVSLLPGEKESIAESVFQVFAAIWLLAMSMYLGYLNGSTRDHQNNQEDAHHSVALPQL